MYCSSTYHHMDHGDDATRIMWITLPLLTFFSLKLHRTNFSLASVPGKICVDLNKWFIFMLWKLKNFVTDTTFLKASVLECLWLNLQPIFYFILPYQSFLHIFNLFQMVIFLHLVPTLSHF